MVFGRIKRESRSSSPEPAGATRTKSGVVPALSRDEPSPSWRPESAPIPKIWDDEEEEATGPTTAAVPASRTKGNPRLTIMTGVSAGQIVPVDGPNLVVGRSRASDLRLDDDGISRQHCRIMRRPGSIFVEDLGSTNGTFLNGGRVGEAQAVAPGDRIQIGPVVLQLAMFDDTEDTLARRLFQASTRDPLTSAFNRYYFCQRLEAEMSHAQRHKSPVSVMLLDLDGLKAINDQYGRGVGDDLLRAVVETISAGIRSEDLFCRYGGEELALLVREPLTTAARTAERLRLRVENLRLAFGKKTLQITTSIGVAEAGEPGAQLTGEGILRVAEKRLHRAKLLGKNRVATE